MVYSPNHMFLKIGKVENHQDGIIFLLWNCTLELLQLSLIPEESSWKCLLWLSLFLSPVEERRHQSCLLDTSSVWGSSTSGGGCEVAGERRARVPERPCSQECAFVLIKWSTATGSLWARRPTDVYYKPAAHARACVCVLFPHLLWGWILWLNIVTHELMLDRTHLLVFPDVDRFSAEMFRWLSEKSG